MSCSNNFTLPSSSAHGAADLLQKSFRAPGGDGAPPAAPTASPPRRGGVAAEGADG
jgi:hypothetical protein